MLVQQFFQLAFF